MHHFLIRYFICTTIFLKDLPTSLLVSTHYNTGLGIFSEARTIRITKTYLRLHEVPTCILLSTNYNIDLGIFSEASLFLSYMFAIGTYTDFYPLLMGHFFGSFNFFLSCMFAIGTYPILILSLFFWIPILV